MSNPLETMDEINRDMNVINERDHARIVGVLFVLVVKGEVTFVVGIDDVPVPRIGNDEAALAPAGLKPILRGDHSSIGPARYPDIRVVLLCAVDVIRKRVIDRDVIKLRGRLVLLCRPRFSSVSRNRDAAIVRVPNSLRVRWIDPEPVMIAMTCGQKGERFAAIDRTEEPSV